MAGIHITCPGCARVLQLKEHPPADRKLKCPRCGAVFLPHWEDENETAGFQEKPNTKTGSPSQTDEDEEDLPLIKKKRGKKSYAVWIVGGLLFVGSGGCLLSCVACGVGAFLWPGFLVREPNNNNIIDFVPANSIVLFGANTKALHEKNQLDTIVKQLEAQTKNKEKMPIEMKELLRDAEKLMVCMRDKHSAEVLLILASNPASVQKLKKMAVLGPEEKIGGKHRVFRPGTRDRNWPLFLAMPGDRLVLASNLNEQDTIALLDHARKSEKEKSQAPQSPALPFIKSVEQSQVWGGWIFEEEARKAIRDEQAKLMGGPPMPQIQSMRAGYAALAQAKGGNFSAENVNDITWKLRVQFECLNERDARDLTQAGVAFKQLLAFAQFAPPDPRVPPSFLRDAQTLDFQQRGSTAVLNMQLSTQTMAELVKLGQEK